MGHHNRRHQSPANFRITKLGAGHGNRQIANSHYAGAAGNGRSIDGRNRGMGEVVNRVEHLGQSVSIRLDDRRIGIHTLSQFRQIHPGTKRRAVAGEDHRTHR